MAGESWLLSLDGNLHRAASGRHGLSGLIKKDVINTGRRSRRSTAERLLKALTKGGARRGGTLCKIIPRRKLDFNLDVYFT